MTTNEILFKTLEEKGLKQADLAKALDVEKSVITSWKRRGNDLPTKYLVQICTFLDISIYELLDIEAGNFDQELIKAYHAAHPGTQECVRKLLDIQDPGETTKLLSSKIG